LFLECWARTKEITGFKRQIDLPRFLGIEGQTVGNAKRDDRFPLKWAHKISKKYNVSVEWIMSGEEATNMVRESSEEYRDGLSEEDVLEMQELKRTLELIWGSGAEADKAEISRAINRLAAKLRRSKK